MPEKKKRLLSHFNTSLSCYPYTYSVSHQVMVTYCVILHFKGLLFLIFWWIKLHLPFLAFDLRFSFLVSHQQSCTFLIGMFSCQIDFESNKLEIKNYMTKGYIYTNLMMAIEIGEIYNILYSFKLYYIHFLSFNRYSA